MTERRQLNLKIKSGKVEKWQEAIEENAEYSSMTDLVRQSVEKEIAGTHDSRQPADESIGRDMAETKDVVRSLENEIGTLSSIVKDLQNTVKTDPDDKHLRSEIFAAIPDEDAPVSSKSPEQIANELGGPIDEQVAFQILEDLADEISTIRRLYIEGATKPIETKYQKKV